jgi:hypothetical protein
MSHRGGKSHQIGRGAPHVSLGFQTSMRAEATKRRAAGDAAAPRAGMTTFKGENVWCKKCAGSKHGDAHSRLGDDGDDYANCTLYGSTAKLSKEKKRSLQLIGQLRPASDAAAAQGEPAPKKARTEAEVPVDCSVRLSTLPLCGEIVAEGPPHRAARGPTPRARPAELPLHPAEPGRFCGAALRGCSLRKRSVYGSRNRLSPRRTFLRVGPQLRQNRGRVALVRGVRQPGHTRLGRAVRARRARRRR